MKLDLADLRMGDQLIIYEIYWQVIDIEQLTDSNGDTKFNATLEEIRNFGAKRTLSIYGDFDTGVYILPRGVPTIN